MELGPWARPPGRLAQRILGSHRSPQQDAVAPQKEFANAESTTDPFRQVVEQESPAMDQLHSEGKHAGWVDPVRTGDRIAQDFPSLFRCRRSRGLRRVDVETARGHTLRLFVFAPQLAQLLRGHRSEGLQRRREVVANPDTRFTPLALLVLIVRANRAQRPRHRRCRERHHDSAGVWPFILDGSPTAVARGRLRRRRDRRHRI
jgi:hypothetical protein